MLTPKGKWVVAIVACAVMITAATAWAQQEQQKKAAGRGTAKEAMARRVESFWKNADTNKDGVLDLKEYLAIQQKEFTRMDANGDGKLTREEMAAPRKESPRARTKAQEQAGQGEGIKRLFANADANGDGKISREEAPEQISNRFDRIDSNGDGFITVQEIQEVMRKRQGAAAK